MASTLPANVVAPVLAFVIVSARTVLLNVVTAPAAMVIVSIVVAAVLPPIDSENVIVSVPAPLLSVIARVTTSAADTALI